MGVRAGPGAILARPARVEAGRTRERREPPHNIIRVKAKKKDSLATTHLNLQVFEIPQKPHPAGKMTWEDVMAETEPQRAFYMKHFDSPEKRLRNKNPAPFRMAP